MAEKVIILKVDLSCSWCRRKMEKIFKKYQDEWNIKEVNWDDKDNKITLSGPFNPDELINNLCCKACKTIKDIIIPENDDSDPEPEPPPSGSLAAKPPTTICLTCQICLYEPCHANHKSCNCDCSSGRRLCSCDGGYRWNNPPYQPPYQPLYYPAYGRPTCQFYYECEPTVCVIM